MKDKLKTLMQTWPAGTIATQSWLNGQGIYKQLSQKYVTSGWLRSVGHGAFSKTGDMISWEGGVYALQKDNDHMMHVGGLTALELMGRSHYIRMGQTYLQMFNTTGRTPKRYLPKWFINYFSDININFIRHRLFTTNVGIQDYDCHTFKIKISGAERAILEILSLLPQKITLNHAYLLMESQHLLRPSLCQKLLENCTSHKAKRLFLFFAQKHDLPVCQKLDQSKIELGTGRRIIGSGGYYYDKFQLDLPEQIPDEDAEVEF